MRDTLPKNPKRNECVILNLDNSKQRGTHWVAYIKQNNIVTYFDSFGALKPPQELVNYLGNKVKIYYNYEKFQNYSQINCGHLCLQFLYKNSHLFKNY
jgi:hypothetical protein